MVNTYILLYALAALVFGLVGERCQRTSGSVAPGVYHLALLLAIPAFFAGMAAPGLATAMVDWLQHGVWTFAWGSRIYAGVAVAIVTLLVFLRVYGYSLWQFTDPLMPALGFTFFVGRIGCLMAGCCGGSITHAWWGLYLPDERGIWEQRYPTQILSGGFYLAWGLFSLWMQSRPAEHRPAWWNTSGGPTLLFLFLFCLERFSLEFLREDYRPLWGPLSAPALLMLLGMGLMLWAGWKARLVLTGEKRGAF